MTSGGRDQNAIMKITKRIETMSLWDFVEMIDPGVDWRGQVIYWMRAGRITTKDVVDDLGVGLSQEFFESERFTLSGVEYDASLFDGSADSETP